MNAQNDIKADLTRFLTALEGCRSCTYDEAEGDLFNHCDTCCRAITTAAYALFAQHNRQALRRALDKFINTPIPLPEATYLPEAPYGGYVMRCAHCSNVAILPYIDAAHTAVRTEPASGWQIDLQRGTACPACATALTAFTAPSIRG